MKNKVMYEWVVDSSIVTEERMHEIAAEEITLEELADALYLLQSERGFSWLLSHLKSEALHDVIDLAKKVYTEEYFLEVEDEEDENENHTKRNN